MAREGDCGLSLETQRKSNEDSTVSLGVEMLARFNEVESGRKADRPERTKALHLAKVTGATLMIAKLTRLSCNAAFLLALRRGRALRRRDMPEANDLTVGITALVAQAEREAISRRTKEAYAVARARRVKLGNPKGGAALRAAVLADAAAYAADLAPVLEDVRAAGHSSLRAMAAELTAREIRPRLSYLIMVAANRHREVFTGSFGPLG